MAMRASRAGHAVVAAVLIGISAVGCGGMGGPDPVTSNVPDGLYAIRGMVVGVDIGRRILEINHEAIPGLMPAMTMPYEVADPALLQGLAPGDRVHGTLRVDSRGYIIIALQRD